MNSKLREKILKETKEKLDELIEKIQLNKIQVLNVKYLSKMGEILNV